MPTASLWRNWQRNSPSASAAGNGVAPRARVGAVEVPFGANMGDFCARNVGLGHVAGLPFLALALAAVIVCERFDQSVRQAYYWTAIIIVRTGATNFADFACGDMKLPRLWVIAGLTALLAMALLASWQFAWRRKSRCRCDQHTCRLAGSRWA